MRLNVGYMYQKPIGTSREVPVEIESFALDDLHIIGLKSVVQLSRTREGLLLQVKAEANVQADCVRCLDQFSLPLDVEFEELYQFPSRRRQETDLILPDDGFVDLAPLFREYLVLATPIKQICMPDCQGLCPICGVNLNNSDCEHETQQTLPSATTKADKVG